MDIVRSLQTAFYSSPGGGASTRTEISADAGIAYNLALWRVPWIELPGRTNVLNVHNPVYTNMFEQVLHGEPPWYVGHLHMPSDQSLLSSESHLRTWDEQVAADTDAGATDPPGKEFPAGTVATPNKQPVHDQPMGAMSASAAVLGTLMRIVDYRRLEDGRLLLLVQGLERFAVTDVVQELPYSVCHAQLIPDTEEVDDSPSPPTAGSDHHQQQDWVSGRTEGDVSPARALAIAESFGRWHRYEYEHTLLPLPLRRELKVDEVVGSAMAKVLPYAPYSSVVKAEQVLAQESIGMPPIASPPTAASASKRDRSMPDYAQNTLEYRLLRGNILHQPGITDPALLELSCDELEVRVWLALDEYLKKTKKAVSPVLLGFLPQGVKWPQGFLLEKIADAIGEQTELASKFVRLSRDYPSGRRHKRLSYSVAALLEDVDSVNTFRQELLAIPSTKSRMAYVLQLLEDEWGAFQ